jgi:replicative DNA helicase
MRAVGTGKLLRIFDRDMAMGAIESRCRMLRESWQPDLVTIDYLTLIQGGHGKSLYEKVTDVANRLVELRKVLGCPVVVAAQLSRGVEGEDREPRCSDARDSGAIEQAAHRMVFIWRPRNDFTSAPQIGAEIGQRNLYDCYILQAKFRDGPICNVRTRFQSSLARFVEP